MSFYMVEQISRRGFLNGILAESALVAAGGLASIAEAWHDGPKRIGPKEIISIEDYNSKFIWVTYKDKNGQIQKESIFHGKKLRHGDVEVDPHDYIPAHGGSMPYGPFDVNKYIEYKKSRQK